MHYKFPTKESSSNRGLTKNYKKLTIMIKNNTTL